jgi:hypothetical protein
MRSPSTVKEAVDTFVTCHHMLNASTTTALFSHLLKVSFWPLLTCREFWFIFSSFQPIVCFASLAYSRHVLLIIVVQSPEIELSTPTVSSGDCLHVSCLHRLTLLENDQCELELSNKVMPRLRPIILKSLEFPKINRHRLVLLICRATLFRGKSAFTRLLLLGCFLCVCRFGLSWGDLGFGFQTLASETEGKTLSNHARCWSYLLHFLLF